MKKEGFSLIELMIVVAIIAILTAVGITAFGSVTKNARDAKRKADVEAIAKALENQFDPETGEYPSDIENEFFTAKEPPKTPEGGNYAISWTGTETNHTGFKVCATLDDDSTQYCKQSSQGKFVTVTESPPVDDPTEDVLPPAEVSPPDPVLPTQDFLYIFVSSASYIGSSLGGLSGADGADAKCRVLAKTAGLSGSEWYKAWLSDSTTNVKDRIYHSYLRYKDTKGNIIADDLDGLMSGSLKKPIKYTETGTTVTLFNYVWTNTDQFGVRKKSTDSEVCNNWQSNIGNPTGSVGDPLSISSTWTDFGSKACSNSYRLYCLQEYP